MLMLQGTLDTKPSFWRPRQGISYWTDICGKIWSQGKYSIRGIQSLEEGGWHAKIGKQQSCYHTYNILAQIIPSIFESFIKHQENT